MYIVYALGMISVANFLSFVVAYVCHLVPAPPPDDAVVTAEFIVQTTSWYTLVHSLSQKRIKEQNQ